jgi:hypothetical protein
MSTTQIIATGRWEYENQHPPQKWLPLGDWNRFKAQTLAQMFSMASRCRGKFSSSVQTNVTGRR